MYIKQFSEGEPFRCAGNEFVMLLPRDVTVLLIEHDMDLVFSFTDRISVLVGGALLVEGTPAEIANDAQA